MKINYLVTPLEHVIGERLRGAWAPASRRAVVAFGTTLVFLGVLLAVQAARLGEAQRAGAGTEARIVALADELRDTHALERDVARLRALVAHVAELRRSGDVAANEVAAIGNALPDDAWLTALRRDHDTIGLDGTAASLAAIAATLENLTHIASAGTGRLVSVRSVAGVGERYALVLEPRR